MFPCSNGLTCFKYFCKYKIFSQVHFSNKPRVEIIANLYGITYVYILIFIPFHSYFITLLKTDVLMFQIA